jgi:hypothetical protein
MVLRTPPTCPQPTHVPERTGGPPPRRDASPADAEQMAISLFTVWAARTGRTLRNVPVSELTARELEDFWTDDQLEEPYAGPSPEPRRELRITGPAPTARCGDAAG